MISAKVELTQALKQQRQFVALTGSGHNLLLDDAAGGTGPKPIELVAAGLAGCTAFDVITVLRQKYHQKVTGYEVRVEADQAERPPQVFTAVRIHHVVTGIDIDVAALEEAIRLSEEKYCSVGAMVQKTASFHTTYEIVEEKTEWMKANPDCRSPELKIRVKFVAVATVTLWISLAAQAQQSADPSPLTLQQAVRIALEKNPLRKAALADTKASSADVREARSALMPRVTFSETATRGNDPVYVFGNRLRQQRFTADDFSLNKLNTPLPFGNFSTRFGGTWNLFDSFASWHGVNRAKQMNEAAGHQLERTEQEIVFRVVNAYYGALLATKQLELAEQALKTSQSILDRSQSRFDSWLGGGIGPAHREGADGRATAGTHSG